MTTFVKGCRQRFALALALTLTTLTAPGCVSVVSTAMGPRPYVGSRTSVSYVGTQARQGWDFYLTSALLLLDLPGTFVMDTILLPLTLIASAGQ